MPVSAISQLPAPIVQKGNTCTKTSNINKNSGRPGDHVDNEEGIVPAHRAIVTFFIPQPLDNTKWTFTIAICASVRSRLALAVNHPFTPVAREIFNTATALRLRGAHPLFPQPSFVHDLHNLLRPQLAQPI